PSAALAYQLPRVADSASGLEFALVQGKHVLVRTDKTVTVANINHRVVSTPFAFRNWPAISYQHKLKSRRATYFPVCDETAASPLIISFTSSVIAALHQAPDGSGRVGGGGAPKCPGLAA
ncbi:hypothetical protein M9458_041230, partial [Cirrhinus mrigala]